jgi:exopolyphosphatase/pppGpp-phosphohydrolase
MTEHFSPLSTSAPTVIAWKSAGFDHGQIRRTEYIKETVRQGNGLDEARNLTPEAMAAGWGCLARFGERWPASRSPGAGRRDADAA